MSRHPLELEHCYGLDQTLLPQTDPELLGDARRALWSFVQPGAHDQHLPEFGRHHP